jgi:lipoprotein NlpI
VGYLAQERKGEAGAGQLQQNAVLLKGNAWPYPVVDLYLGQASPQAVMDSARWANEKCEAHFYVGQWHLLKKQLTQASAELRTAAVTCARSMFEYGASVAELARLKQ